MAPQARYSTLTTPGPGCFPVPRAHGTSGPVAARPTDSARAALPACPPAPAQLIWWDSNRPGRIGRMSSGWQLDHTPDGHFVVIDGRRWRATDPMLPEDVASRLRKHLMAARRAVRSALSDEDEAAVRAARGRVQRAKVALGERGTPWWEQSAAQRRRRWEDGLTALDE
ncbi:hypothetical protein GCM10010331_16270 [Streptomyces xanthochromogenes]|nr:hypothetical protein GCM10010331_16270 [Streptomyces xanthochromogenes]